jgi:hypothetical protein
MPAGFPEMEKHVTCKTVDDHGQVFAEAVLVSSRGGELEKTAGRRHPAIEAFLAELRPDPKFQYVLMQPMGASEYWGRNINGDYFPEICLDFDFKAGDQSARIQQVVQRFLAPWGKGLPPFPIREFGFRTFEDALRYRHHVNKDPSIAYGDIPLAVWNPFTKKVEVIVRHWRDKARQLGAHEIIDDIDNGRPRQISMGCKVPFDVCTICGNISRTTDQYCTHLKHQMGHILPDGRVVAALNLFPRFFDLSDVIVPAASESGVLEKVAQVRGTLPETSGKQGTDAETGDMTKRMPAKPESRAAVAVSEQEEDIPPDVLERGSLAQLLTTLAALGVVLKPHEFQYSALVRRPGCGGAARLLAQRRLCFLPDAAPRDPMPMSVQDFDPELALQAGPRILVIRSGMAPFFSERVLDVMSKTASASPRARQTYTEAEPLLRGLSGAYASYRAGLEKIASLIESVDSKHPSLYRRLMGGPLLDWQMTKAASADDYGLSGCSLPVYVHNAYRSVPEDVPYLPSIRPSLRPLIHP